MARRTKEEAAHTRDTILHSALAVFSTKGYAATTLEDVAAKAGVTRGAIYWHFGSKAALFNELIAGVGSRSASLTQSAAAAGGTLPEVLQRVFVDLLAAVEGDPQLRSVMELALFKTEMTAELRPGLQERTRAGQALLAGVAQAMQAGISAGELRADLAAPDLARGFLAAQNGLLYMWLADPKAFNLTEAARSVAQILVRGLGRS